MEEEKKNNSDKNNIITSSINSNIEDIIEEKSDSSYLSHSSRRTKSLGKITYSKTSKSIKRHFNPYDFTLNLKNSVSTPSLAKTLTGPKASLSDYEIIQDLGNGSYGKVVLAKSKEDGKKFAIKVIRKDLLNNLDKQYEIHVEKFCLIYLSHPNIIKFNKSFQDRKHLYFVLEYCKNKDLGKLIQKLGSFNYKLAQYYAAEILSAISYMKKKEIYHRDLKPENIGIDEDMHLKILDFATSNMEGKYFDKKYMKFVDVDKDEYNEALNKIKKEKNLSKNENVEYVNLDGHKIMNLKEKFVGTPEYIAPEVLEYKYDLIGPGVDIWSFGVMLYLFFAGKTPFKGKDNDETFENIKKLNYSWEIKDKYETKIIDIPNDAKDLIQKILVKDPKQRIGYGSKDYKEIKEHPFFKGINFDTLSDEPIPLSKSYSMLESLGYINNNDIAQEKDDDIYINVLNKSDNDIFDDRNSIGSMDNAELRISGKKLTYDKLNNFLRDSLQKNENKEIQDNKDIKDMIIEENVKNINSKNIISSKSEKHNKIYKNDEVLVEGILYKKSPFVHYNKRYAKLFSKGHLDYYHFPSKMLKGSIIINENSKINPIDDFRFELISQNKIYHFKHISERITDNWVENINKIIFEKIKMANKK
jgi:serine/threonine protein kinase